MKRLTPKTVEINLKTLVPFEYKPKQYEEIQMD